MRLYPSILLKNKPSFLLQGIFAGLQVKGALANLVLLHCSPIIYNNMYSFDPATPLKKLILILKIRALEYQEYGINSHLFST